MGLSLDEITDLVSSFIARPDPVRFDRLALEVFAFQFETNPPYRNLCLARNRTPDRISSWEEIPPVPAAAFKEFRLSCLEPGAVSEAVFTTTGTTRGPAGRGTHIVPRLSVFRSAILPNFEEHLLADGARPRMLILTGSPEMLPRSSLAFMMETVRGAFGRPGSEYFVTETGLDLDRLVDALRKSEDQPEPVLLLGVSLAFSDLMDRLESEGLSFSLPPGSRIMDTGGFKGRSPAIPPGALLSLYEKRFGIPEAFAVNEYGMTELGSQFYDNSLKSRFAGRTAPRRKSPPPWVRTRVIHPETLEEVPPGETGMLQHLDLANCGSVSTVLTEDLGCAYDDGFTLAGRLPGAEPRGCSLLLEALRKAP